MFTAILMSIAGGLYEISLKKSLDLSRLSHSNFLLIGQLVWLVSVLVIIAGGWVDYDQLFDLKTGAILTIIALFWWLSEYFKQKAYDSEKVSVLLPYTNLTPVLLIVLGYLFLSDSSLLAFIIALATTLLVLGDSVYRHFIARMSPGVWYVLLANICDVTEMLLSAYLVISLPVPTFIVWALSIYYAMALVAVIFGRRSRELFHQSIPFYKHRLLSSVLWYIYWFLEIFLYSEVGIVMTTLLSLLSTAIVFVGGYYFLDDRPQARDVLLTILVLTGVALGYWVNELYSITALFGQYN